MGGTTEETEGAINILCWGDGIEEEVAMCDVLATLGHTNAEAVEYWYDTLWSVSVVVARSESLLSEHELTLAAPSTWSNVLCLYLCTRGLLLPKGHTLLLFTILTVMSLLSSENLTIFLDTAEELSVSVS